MAKDRFAGRESLPPFEPRAGGPVEIPGDGGYDLSIVVVSYNTVDLLRQCLQSIRADTGASREVLVVDNASSDDSAAMVEAEFPEMRIIANQENLGFTRANNQALARARGRYLMLLNPDAVLVPGAINTLVGHLDASPDVGVVGPRLLYPDGTAQSSRRRFPTVATAFVESTVIQRWFPGLPLLRRYYCDDLPVDARCEVDWVVGACMVVRQRAVEQVGLLDEGFFMYSEELDWCRRLKSAGWKVMFDPSATVIHHESRSASQNLARRDILFNDSKIRYFGKHHGRFWAGLLRVHILFSFVEQYAEEGVKLILGHRPGLRKQRLAQLSLVIRHQSAMLVGGSR